MKRYYKTIALSTLSCALLSACNSGSGANATQTSQKTDTLFTEGARFPKIVSIPVTQGAPLKASATDLSGFGAIPGLFYSDVSSMPTILQPCVAMQNSTSIQEASGVGGVNFSSSQIYQSYANASTSNYSAQVKSAFAHASIDIANSASSAEMMDNQNYSSSLYFAQNTFNLRNYYSNGTLVNPSTRSSAWQQAGQNWSRCGVGYVNTVLGINSQALNFVVNFNQSATASQTSAGFARSVAGGISIGNNAGAEVSNAYGYAKSLADASYTGSGYAYGQFYAIRGDTVSLTKANLLKATLGAASIPSSSTITMPAALGSSTFTSLWGNLSSWLAQMMAMTPGQQYTYTWVVPTVGFNVAGKTVTQNFITWDQDMFSAPDQVVTPEYTQIYDSYIDVMKIAQKAIDASNQIDSVYNLFDNAVANSSADYQKYQQQAIASGLYTTMVVNDNKLYYKLLNIRDAASFMMNNPTSASMVSTPVSDVVKQCFSYRALVVGLATSPTSAQNQIAACQTATDNYVAFINTTIGALNYDKRNLAIMGLTGKLQYQTDDSDLPSFSKDNPKSTSDLEEFFRTTKSSAADASYKIIAQQKVGSSMSPYTRYMYLPFAFMDKSMIKTDALANHITYWLDSLMNLDWQRSWGADHRGSLNVPTNLVNFFIKRTKQWLVQTEQTVSTYFFTGQYTEDANGNYRIQMSTRDGGITLEQGFPLDYAAANLGLSGESSVLDLPGNYLNSASYNGLDRVNPGESGGVLIIKPSTTSCANNDGNCLMDIANSTLEIPYHNISIDATATMAVDQLSWLKTAISGQQATNKGCGGYQGYGMPLMLACGFSNNSQCPIETRQKYAYYPSYCGDAKYFYTNDQVANGSVGTYDPLTFAFTGFNDQSLTSPLIKYGYSPLSIIQSSLPNAQNSYTQSRYGSWVATKANDDSGSLYVGTGGNDINRVLYNVATKVKSTYNFFNPNRTTCTYHVLGQTVDANKNSIVTYAPESSCVQNVIMFLQITATDPEYDDDSQNRYLFHYMRNGNTLVSPFRYGTRQLPNIRITYPANFSNDFIGAK